MTAIYHITHHRNLGQMVADGTIWCDREVQARAVAKQSIAYSHIKVRRATTPVPIGPGGYVGDYTPFYFAPRSPMLYVAHKGSVPDYKEGQAPIVHLVAAAEDVRDAGLPFVFTDGHAVMKLSQFFSELGRLADLDWTVMRSRMWNDTPEFPDRSRRRQAEFLVHEACPWKLVREIGVIDDATKKLLEGIVSDGTPIIVRRTWYYD